MIAIYCFDHSYGRTSSMKRSCIVPLSSLFSFLSFVRPRTFHPRRPKYLPYPTIIRSLFVDVVIVGVDNRAPPPFVYSFIRISRSIDSNMSSFSCCTAECTPPVRHPFIYNKLADYLKLRILTRKGNRLLSSTIHIFSSLLAQFSPLSLSSIDRCRIR